jgi:hypothetical protein
VELDRPDTSNSLRECPFAVGLVHHPVKDRAGTVVATNVTNFDIHDIARASKAYGVDQYFIIHPQHEQLMFVSRILDHWRVGEGSRYNPMRKTALDLITTAVSVEAAARTFSQQLGGLPVEVVATTAREIPGVTRWKFRDLRESLRNPEEPAKLLIFGTGFGMTEELLRSCQGILEPIQGAPPADYRHLSVRSAVTICLDRLLGSW